jgi:hypothetical protein
MIVAQRAAVLAVALVLAGCGSNTPPAASPSASSQPTPAQAAASPSSVATEAPTAVPTPSVSPTSEPTPTPTPTPTPPLFDVTTFLKVFDSMAVTKHYPATSGAKVWSLYLTAVKADPALGRLLGKQAASTNPKKTAPTVQVCAGQAPNPDGITFSQYEDFQAACGDALPRLIWYINHNRDAKALPLLRALVGYIVHNNNLGKWSDVGDAGTTFWWRPWMVASVKQYADYLDGSCGGPAGLGTC